jgi:hypothetical protein
MEKSKEELKIMIQKGTEQLKDLEFECSYLQTRKRR